MHEHRGQSEPALDELVSRMTPVDLLLIEGFKAESYDKIEVHRPALGKALLNENDPRIVAVASDAPLPRMALPVLDLDDTPAIADFIVKHCGLAALAPGVA